MNLQQFIKENPAANLATIQAHSETIDKKQVGSGSARGFFVAEGIWTKLKLIQGDITHPLFALADAVVVTASDASSYFGLDLSTAEGQGNIEGANMLTDAGVMTTTQRDAFLDKALKTTFPFAGVTQIDVDEAIVANLLALGSTAHSYTIGGYPTNAIDANIVKTNKEFIVDVIFDAPVPVDCVVSVRVLLLDAETNTYVPESDVDTVRVSVSSTSKNYRIKRTFSARKMQFEATCNMNLAFQVKVREA